MITTTMKDILKARDAFQVILGCKIPALSAMIAKKTLKLIVAEVESFEEAREALVKKYGKETEKGFSIDKDDKNAMKLFNDEINPILDHKIDLNCDTLPISLFEKAEIAPAVLIDLDKFIVE